MGGNTYNVIRQAIIDKQQVIGNYDGHFREMRPHVIGTKNGRQQALFYQSGVEVAVGRDIQGLGTTADAMGNR